MEKKVLGIIDLHVHVFPARMFRAAWGKYKSRGWGFHKEYADQIKKTLTNGNG